MVYTAVADKCPGDTNRGVVDLEERKVTGLEEESACLFLPHIP
jgi:hypothetical protein